MYEPAAGTNQSENDRPKAENNGMKDNERVQANKSQHMVLPVASQDRLAIQLLPFSLST